MTESILCLFQTQRAPCLFEVMIGTALFGAVYIRFIERCFYWHECFEDWRARRHVEMRMVTP